MTLCGSIGLWALSTAVSGLAAKPIIDILIEVTDIIALDALNANMKSIDYEPKGEFGILGRRYFKKGGNVRTHIHAFAHGDSNIIRYIAFRDYLRTHAEVAQEYGKFKKIVAARCDNNIDQYCDEKDVYVKRIEAAAVRWLKNAHCAET